MPEPDILDRKIRELMHWQSVAWRRIADPSLPKSDRQELRDQIKEIDQSLRYYLSLMSERLQLEARSVEDVGNNRANIEFRILA
jgi:hypothetical protein